MKSNPNYGRKFSSGEEKERAGSYVNATPGNRRAIDPNPYYWVAIISSPPFFSSSC